MDQGNGLDKDHGSDQGNEQGKDQVSDQGSRATGGFLDITYIPSHNLVAWLFQNICSRRTKMVGLNIFYVGPNLSLYVNFESGSVICSLAFLILLRPSFVDMSIGRQRQRIMSFIGVGPSTDPDPDPGGPNLEPAPVPRPQGI